MSNEIKNSMFKEKYTKIPNALIKGDMELNSKELSILTLLYMTRNGKDVCIFNLQYIYDNLNIKSNNTYGKNEIKKILNLFYTDEILIYFNSIFLKDESIIENISLYDKNKIIFAELNQDIFESYTLILDHDIYKIIEYSNKYKIDVYSLIKTYMYIFSTFNYDDKSEDYLLGYPSIANISETINSTEETILKYIDILRELEIFIYDYSGFKQCSNGEIKNGNMYYTKFGNDEILLNKLNKERKEHGYIQINKRCRDKSNLKRSLKQQINRILKNQKSNKLSIVEQETLQLLKEKYEELN
ncbi:hypothetical protein DVV91_17220 [Clostridium botulinum]|uniref:hypothetical protein n=1 Tax=Clostridium botulinum TaxID=1491 RepID=UPI00196829AF|nr:hypothetical protein [Clostridium botulinum]MBN1076063.1 hypothetical protein [Clostridium botulinum]